MVVGVEHSGVWRSGWRENSEEHDHCCGHCQWHWVVATKRWCHGDDDLHEDCAGDGVVGKVGDNHTSNEQDDHEENLTMTAE